jgi:hypothetical protein
VYRLSRFPYLNATPLKISAYEAQKKAYMAGVKLWDVPIKEVILPFTDAGEGDGKEIPLYVRTPPQASKADPAPVLLLITGLDGHRPDNSQRTDEFLKRGWASVQCDIPGVADCPSSKTDPLAPDRLFTTILSYIRSVPEFNARKVIAWGLSAGGYYAIRLAHTHASQLAGSVGHGAGTHHYIGKEWLSEVNHHEYPFDLKRAYLGKYGYESWEELVEGCQKRFSLVESGLLEKQSCRLLLINGMLDGCMPVEDSMLLAEYGRPKEFRFVQNRAHMGKLTLFFSSTRHIPNVNAVLSRLSRGQWVCLSLVRGSHGHNDFFGVNHCDSSESSQVFGKRSQSQNELKLVFFKRLLFSIDQD